MIVRFKKVYMIFLSLKPTLITVCAFQIQTHTHTHAHTVTHLGTHFAAVTHVPGDATVALPNGRASVGVTGTTLQRVRPVGRDIC